jgi:hypothetical protein
LQSQEILYIVTQCKIEVMTSKRQHTIPQFYLRPFLSPGLVYRRGSSSPRVTKSPKNVAVERNYYGQEKEGLKTLDGINSLIEDWGAPALKKLVEEPENISQNDWTDLSYLFANFAVRTPNAIEEMRTALLSLADQVNEKAQLMAARLEEALQAGSDLSEFPSWEMEDDSPSMTIDQSNKSATAMRAEGGHQLIAGLTFGEINDLAKLIQKMTFLLLEAPNNLFFITSDRPLVLQSRITGSRVCAGWANPDALGTIALCPSHFLLMYYGESYGLQHSKATPDMVQGLNLETIKFANSEIYSPFKYLEAENWMKAIKS